MLYTKVTESQFDNAIDNEIDRLQALLKKMPNVANAAERRAYIDGRIAGIQFICDFLLSDGTTDASDDEEVTKWYERRSAERLADEDRDYTDEDRQAYESEKIQNQRNEWRHEFGN